MTYAPEIVLVGAVTGVGILHTIVPDHWLPITLIARQRKWTRRRTALAALGAGTGHVVSTLLIGLLVWLAGTVFASRAGAALSLVSSAGLILFGGWIAVQSLREMRAHDHDHDHDHAHDHAHAHVPPEGASSRTALLLILGSSPMIEGLPAFFAAGRYGPGLIAVMSLAFAVATIATYVILCVSSSAGLERLRLGKFEAYGEVISGAFIALIGVASLFF